MESRQYPGMLPPGWLPPPVLPPPATGQLAPPNQLYQYTNNSNPTVQAANHLTYPSLPGQGQFQHSSNQPVGQVSLPIGYEQFMLQAQPVMLQNLTAHYTSSNENYSSTPSVVNSYPSGGNQYPSVHTGGNPYPPVLSGGSPYTLTPVLTQASVLIPPSPGASSVAWMPPQSYPPSALPHANITMHTQGGSYLYHQPPPQLQLHSTNGQVSAYGYNQVSLAPMQASGAGHTLNGTELVSQPPSHLLPSSSGQVVTVSYNQSAAVSCAPSRGHDYGASSKQRIVARTIVPMHPVGPQISRQGLKSASMSSQVRPQSSQPLMVNSSRGSEIGNGHVSMGSVAASNQMDCQTIKFSNLPASTTVQVGFPNSQIYANVNALPPNLQTSAIHYNLAQNQTFVHVSQSSLVSNQQSADSFNSSAFLNSSAQLTPSSIQNATENVVLHKPRSSVDRKSNTESDKSSCAAPVSKQNSHCNNRNNVTSRNEHIQKSSLELEGFDCKRSNIHGSSYSGSMSSSHEEDLFPMPSSGSKDIFTGTSEDDLFTEMFDRDYMRMSSDSPTRDDLFPKPPIPIARDSTNSLKRSISEMAYSFNGSDDSKKVRHQKSVESLDEHKSISKTAVRRASAAAKQVEVTIATKGTAQSTATFKIFKCDFCRCTVDTVAAMDAHLVSSKHLSGSEFGAKTGTNNCTELVYIARILSARNGRVSNKSLVIACPSCRAVFDDIFTCALHHKYAHSQWPDSATVNTNNNFQRFGKQSTSLAFGLDIDLDKVVLGSAVYSLCPVILFETVTLPFDQDLDCSQCNARFSSLTSLFDHWDSETSHQPAISKSDNEQIFVLSVCTYCQCVFRDSFMECARHILTHFSTSVSSVRGNLSPPRRTLTMEVKQVMMPLRKEELPPFDEKHDSSGMKDEMFTLFKLQDNGQLNPNALQLVRSRVTQLQLLMAANNL